MPRYRPTTLPPPYLKRIWLEGEGIDRTLYPWCLPLLRGEFELDFDRPITIIAGENGVGKSTLLKGIAVLAGFDEAGGGPGYAIARSTARLRSSEAAARWRASCAPAGFPRSGKAGSSARRASSRSPAILTRREAHPRTSCRTRTAKAFYAFSRSAVPGRASSCSTNPNQRFHRRGSSIFSHCCPVSRNGGRPR
jgi:hypothetical protein